MIVNLTPHAMHIYPPGTPDRIDPTTVPASGIICIPPSEHYPPVRLGHIITGTATVHDGIPIEDVIFGVYSRKVNWLPEPLPGAFFVVPLVVGLAASDRNDLLVPHDDVRDMSGCIIGSRKLARPAR